MVSRTYNVVSSSLVHNNRPDLWLPRTFEPSNAPLQSIVLCRGAVFTRRMEPLWKLITALPAAFVLQPDILPWESFLSDWQWCGLSCDLVVCSSTQLMSVYWTALCMYLKVFDASQLSVFTLLAASEKCTLYCTGYSLAKHLFIA